MKNKLISLIVGFATVTGLAAAQATFRQDRLSAERVQELEALVHWEAESDRAAAVRVELAYEYRKTGRFTRALDHWLAAWELCKTATEGKAKETADHALVQSASLLASLGRLE